MATSIMHSPSTVWALMSVHVDNGWFLVPIFVQVQPDVMTDELRAQVAQYQALLATESRPKGRKKVTGLCCACSGS